MKRRIRRKRLRGPIHARIENLRERAGLTQLDLADATGVHATAVSHWENGFSRPDISRLPAVALALGVSVSELIAGEKAFAALGQMLGAKAA